MYKDLFICTTPFQVMSAILLKCETQNDSTIIIVNSFDGYKELGKKIQNIFTRVVCLDQTKIWSSNANRIAMKRLSVLFSYINCKKIVKSIIPDISDYRNLYVSSRATIARLFCMYCAEENHQCEIHYYDDGMGSYTNTVIKTKKIDVFFRRILVGKKAASYTYKKHLYSPKLYFFLHDTNEEIISMPDIKKNDQLIRSVFDSDKIGSIANRVIVFDTIHEAEFTDEGKQYNQVMGEIIEHYDDIVVKPHPRASKKVFDCNYYEMPDVPFEILCMKNNYDDKLLISCMSSAVFTPKLLFNQEPTIILLYRLLNKWRKNTSEYDDQLVDALKAVYSDKEKIFVPNNILELNNYLFNI